MSLNGLARIAPPRPNVLSDPGYLSTGRWFQADREVWRRLPPPGGASLQGRPKTIKPAFSPPGQGQPLVGRGPFKCGYCGRYGQPGACEGCGAPNAPAQGLPPRRPDTILRMHEAGILTPNEARAMCGRSPVPAFDMVKR